MDFDVIVIGAGAAGMMCAGTAAARGRRVLLVDHYPKLGEKIRISGGGRCNFTNLHCRPENFLSQNPHFCRSALARFTPQDFIKRVEAAGIRYHEKTLGQLFCDDSSQQIIDLLKDECDRHQVQWCRPVKVAGVQAVDHDYLRYEVATERGGFRSHAVVVATGGLAVPKIGATPFGYQLAEQFGMKVVPPRPALVPLSFDPQLLQHFGDLSGVALDAVTRCGDGKRNAGSFREAILLTHRGLSGPAILQISSYWQLNTEKREPITLDLLPDLDAVEWLHSQQRSRQHLATLLAERLPKRFAQRWCELHDAQRPLAEIGAKTLEALARGLHAWRIMPSGTLGYQKAEVTLGGVDTAELSSQTMESRRQPGLYFVGEVVDVTGHLGGFNFQLAWASGWAAGQAA